MIEIVCSLYSFALITSAKVESGIGAKWYDERGAFVYFFNITTDIGQANDRSNAPVFCIIALIRRICTKSQNLFLKIGYIYIIFFFQVYFFRRFAATLPPDWTAATF